MPNDHDRAELFEYLHKNSPHGLLAKAFAEAPTERVRVMVEGMKAQVADYERMGFVDESADATK